MIFRAPFTRVSRGILCAVLAAGVAWALLAEILTPYVAPAIRFGWMAPTILMELILLAGLQRLWVACLVVNDAGVTVRNFRGDIRLRRTEIKEVFRAPDFAGFRVGLRLKTGDEIRLDGVTWTSPGRTDRAVTEISQALGLP